MATKTKKIISISIDKDLIARVAFSAKVRGQSVSSFIEILVNESYSHLKKYDEEISFTPKPTGNKH